MRPQRIPRNPLISPQQRLLSASLIASALVSSACAVLPERPFEIPSAEVAYTRVSPQLTAAAEDPAWTDVDPIELTVNPKTAPATGEVDASEVKLLWDEDFLYLRFVSEDESIYLTVEGNDKKLFKNDVVELFLDPVGDSRQWFEFQMSPQGDWTDILLLLTAEPESKPDGRLTKSIYPDEHWKNMDWNLPGIRVASQVHPSREEPQLWIVDLALPAKPILKRHDLETWRPMTIRANFIRYNRFESDPTMVQYSWNPKVLYGQPHRSPQLMGELILKPSHSDNDSKEE